MPTSAETAAIVAISFFGAVAQAAVTVRWYEPPSRNGETPTPILEAGIFFVVFGIVFVLLGFVLSVVDGLVPPYGSIVLLLVTPVGFWLAYSAYAGQLATMNDDAERFMGAVVSLVAGILATVLFAL